MTDRGDDGLERIPEKSLADVGIPSLIRSLAGDPQLRRQP